MGKNEVIKKHNFEEQLNNLKELNDKIPATAELTKVEESGGMFGWFSHKVTGEEINGLTEQIQNHLMVQNDMNQYVVKQLNTVYNTFHTLDKEYMEGILISVDNAKTASEQAKAASKEAQNALKETDATIETQSMLIDKLKEFKVKTEKDVRILNNFRVNVESIKHFNDIDNMWNDINSTISELEKCNSDLKQQTMEVHKIKKLTNGVKHLRDVDVLWEDNNRLQMNLANLQKNQEKSNLEFEKKYGELKDTEKYLQEKSEELEKRVSLLSDASAEYKKSLDSLQGLNDELITRSQNVENENALLKEQVLSQKSIINKTGRKVKTLYIAEVTTIIMLICCYVLNIMGII